MAVGVGPGSNPSYTTCITVTQTALSHMVESSVIMQRLGISTMRLHEEICAIIRFRRVVESSDQALAIWQKSVF